MSRLQTASQKYIDKARAVREGEALDIERVNSWIQETVSDLQGEPVVTQYSGGASNWTYCLGYSNREIILRRAPAGTKAKGAHDMGREFRLQQALKPVYGQVPQVLGFCDDTSVMDSDFYIMEKLTGIIPRKNLPRGMALTEQDTRALCTNLLDCMIALHQVDYQGAELQHLGKGAGYVQRQIEGWCHRFTKAKTWNVPSGQFVMNWLRENLPTREHICLTHNDFRFDNVVLKPEKPTEIIGVLDWELATLGDPLMDLGNTLAYWVEADDDFLAQQTRMQPSHLKGMFTRREVVEYYCDKTNIALDDFTFYQVYGLFRLAAIVQQIYYRYHHKQTRNPAYKKFWVFVHYLFWRCKKAIKKGKL